MKRHSQWVVENIRELDIPNMKTPILLGVMALNFLLLGVDVVLAHSENNFFRWEIIPIIYSPIATLATLGVMVKGKNPVIRRIFQGVMWIGVGVGVLGTFFHLAGNANSSKQLLYHLLVKGSPVAAPIAFAGVSMFTLVSEGTFGEKRHSKLVSLVGYGFLAALLAAYFDHARLSFQPGYTMIPLITGTLAVLSALWISHHPPAREETIIFLAIMVLNLVTGLIGFGLHILGDLAGTKTIVIERFLYRNPLLGPLLYCNLALLGGLGILPEPKDVKKAQRDEEVYIAAESLTGK